MTEYTFEPFKIKAVEAIHVTTREQRETFMREADDGRVEVVPMDQYRGLTAGNREEDSVQGEAARLAVTHYRIMGVGQGRTLLQLRLATGRKNQIRAHLAYKGFPIIGDERTG